MKIDETFTPVYKDLIISTIVDNVCLMPVLILVYKDLIISTIVDMKIVLIGI